MAALFTVRNDGPDDLQVMIGTRPVIIRPGHQFSCATNKTLSFQSIAPMTEADLLREAGGDPEMAKVMAKQMGMKPERYQVAEE
jgi:hypothetical protein